MNPADDLERLAFEYLTEPFIKGALQSVFLAHRRAKDDCAREFAATEAENVLGYYRRGKLEGYLRDAADLVPTLTATVEKGDKSNWNHTEVRGGPVVLTESTVATPCALVEKADFRLSLADSPQQPLFGEVEPAGDASLYVLLLHSRSIWPTRAERQKFGHLPGSAYLAFPSRTLDCYVHDINLFERYPEIVAANVPQEWDDEARVIYVDRARKARFA